MSDLLSAAEGVVSAFTKTYSWPRRTRALNALRLAVEQEKDRVNRAAQPSTGAVSGPGRICYCGLCASHCKDLFIPRVCPECVQATEAQR